MAVFFPTLISFRFFLSFTKNAFLLTVAILDQEKHGHALFSKVTPVKAVIKRLLSRKTYTEKESRDEMWSAQTGILMFFFVANDVSWEQLQSLSSLLPCLR